MAEQTPKQIGDEKRRRAAAAAKDLNRRMAKHANGQATRCREEIAKLENGRANPFNASGIARLKRELAGHITALERHLDELKR